MPSLLSLSLRALVLSLLCPSVFSRTNQPRAKRLEEIVEREQDIDKRGVCYDDDTYESFKYWIVDSAPYCSSLLGIVDFTSTVSQTSRTTTSTLSSRFATVTATATVPAVTVFSTTYVPSTSRAVLKRNTPSPTEAPFYQENPYAYSVYADNANASIAASYYSACSCLSLKPSTVDAFAVTSTTRIISGVDSEEFTIYTYVTTGTTTVTATRRGNPTTSSTVSSTISVIPVPPISTGASISLLSSSVTTLLSTIYPNTTTRLPSVTGPSSGLPPTTNRTTSSRPTSGFPTPSGNRTTSSRPTSGFPTPSANQSITISRPTSGFPTPPANMSVTSRPSSGFPIPSVNLSSSSRPSSGFSIPPANFSSTSRGTSGFPSLSTNLSSLVSATVTRPSTSVSSTPQVPTYPSVIFSTISVTPTATPTAANISTPAASSTVAANTASSTATAALSSVNIDRCPGLNGTRVTLEDGQKFEVVCETQYGGPVDIGLSERTFGECIKDCGTANNGFSAVRCRGVTYYPNNPDQNCFFKNLAGLADSSADDDAVSAVLVYVPLLNVSIGLPSAFPTPT
ncbi:MAG: hypothetical protein Q9201_007445, partial [Fulgogasparrea decipioides]